MRWLKVYDVVLLGFRLVKKEDAEVVEVECDAHPRICPHLLPQGFHRARIADAFDDKEGAPGGAGGAELKHLFHEVGVPIVVQVEEVDRYAGFEKKAGEVGCAQVVGLFAAGFQVEGGGRQAPGIDHGAGLGEIDQAKQQALHAQRLVQPFRTACGLHLLFERAQPGILVIGRALVDNAGDEVEGKG